MVQKIKIKQVKNGYIVNSYDLNENDGKESWNEFVFEEKENEINYNEAIQTKKEKIQCFLELVEFLEDRFGINYPNNKDFYLSKKIKQAKKD